MSAVPCPIGWGFHPDCAIGGLTAADLPDMPMLQFLEPDSRNQAVLCMLRENSSLARAVRPMDLVAKYRLPQSTASIILARAKG